MKRKKVLALAALMCMSAQSGSAFAANRYNIEYSGGEKLSSSNVNVVPSLKDLTPLQKFGPDQGNKIQFSSSQWKSAYLKVVKSNNVVECHPYHYISFDGDPKEHDFSDVYYTITASDNSYSTTVQIDRTVIDGSWQGTRKFDIGVDANGSIGAGHGGMLYTDAECKGSKVDSDMPSLSTVDNIKLFIQTNIKINRHGESFTSDEMYFGITDIDAAQSYKILNSGSELSKNSMFAMSDSAFVTEDGLYNMFVSGANKNYIYSQFGSSGHFDANGGDIYAKIDTEAQQSGLQMVFGYMTGAGSGVEYYAKQYVVKYKSDEGGQISGKTTENVISGDTASGTTVKVEEGYEFGYWVADKDVVLKDGTRIEAGGKITSEQLKQVVVGADITFTAKNINESSTEESSVNTPNTGSFTEGSNGLIYTVGLAIPVSIVVIALVGYAVKRNMQKVGFKK